MSHIANSHWLLTLHIVTEDYMILFLYILSSPSLSPYPYVYSPSLFLQYCCVNIQYHISRFCISAFSSVSSLAQPCPTLYEPMNCSTPGLVHITSIRVFSNESTLRMRWPKFIVHLPTLIYSNNCCSVTKLCPALFDPLDCSTPNSSVLYYLLGFAQTHVH